MNIPARFRRAANAAPPWASRLSVSNVFTLVVIVGLAWFAPLIEDGKTTAQQAHRIQQILVVTAAVMALTFIVHTVHDVRRHMQAKLLVSDPEFFQNAMAQYGWKGVMLVGDSYVSFAGLANYNRLTPGAQYLLAREFLEHLASTDTRWWTPANLQKSARQFALRGLVAGIRQATNVVIQVAVALVPFKLMHMIELHQQRRVFIRKFLP